MSVANEVRGEFEITLEGVTYGMRPSHTAIVAYETATGRSTSILAAQARAQAMSLADMAIIVTECVKAWGLATKHSAAPHFQSARVAELLVESDGGLMLAMSRLSLMLFVAATGGVTSAGEKKAMSTKSEPETPDAGTQASPRRRSGGPRKPSGKAPRASSGRRGKSGGS